MVKVATRAANQPMLLVVLVINSWILAACSFKYIENVPSIDALYWSMTTMSTVGYGDVTPHTMLGKSLAIFFQAWSIFYLVPCAVANIIDKVRVDTAKFTHEEQEWTEQSIKAIAAKLDVTLNDAPKDY